MVADALTDGFRIVLVLFGLVMLANAAYLLWRLRGDQSVAVLGILYGVVGAAALFASVLRSRAAVLTMVVAMFAVPVWKTILARRHRL